MNTVAPLSQEARNLAAFLLSRDNCFEKKDLKEEKIYQLAQKVIKMFGQLLPGETLLKDVYSIKKGRKDAPHIRLCGSSVEGICLEIEGEKRAFIVNAFRVGQGASNEAFLAYDLARGEKVILRLLRSSDEEGVENWKLEVSRHKKISDLSHVIGIYGAFIQKKGSENGKLPFLIRLHGEARSFLIGMVLESAELCLNDFCTERELSIEEKKNLIRELLEAGEELHARGFSHNDLNGGNVLVKIEGGKAHIKLADFEHLKSSQEIPRMDGSPFYWPPEAFRLFAGKSGEKIDVFSLGRLSLEIEEGILKKKHPIEKHSRKALTFFEDASMFFLGLEDADSKEFKKEVRKRFGEEFQEKEEEALSISEIWKRIKGKEGASSLREAKRRIIGGEAVQKFLFDSWIKKYPEFAGKKTPLSLYADLVEKKLIPKAINRISPFVEGLKKSGDPYRIAIATLLEPEYEKRAPLKEVLHFLKISNGIKA